MKEKRPSQLRVNSVPGEPPIERAVLATAITDISNGVNALLKSGLNRQAIIVLVADKSKVSRRDIVTVLDALSSLKRDYCS